MKSNGGVRQRELAEDAQENTEQVILDRLMEGQSSYSLVEQGFQRSVVDKVLKNNKDDLDRIRERLDQDEKIILKRIYESEGSLRGTSRATGKSIAYIKKVLEL